VSDTSVDRAIQKALERALRQTQGQCPDHNQLAAYLESRCAAPERQGLEEHFASCGTCRQLLSLSLGLSEPETGEISQRSPARRRLFRFAIPVSAIVAAAVLLGIVVVWQKKSTLTVSQTAELHSISSAPASPAPVVSPPPTVLEERKESVRQFAGKPTARQAQSPAGTTKRSEPPAFVAPMTGDKLAKVPEGIANAATAGKSQPSVIAQVPAEESTKVAEAMTPKQVQDERVSSKAKVTAQNEPMQRRAQVPAQTQGLAQARQMTPAAAVMTFNAAQGFIEQPQDAIAGFSSADVVTRNSIPVRKAGEKVFYPWSGYWIDGECAAHAKAPLMEAEQGSKEYKEAMEQFPGLRDFETASTAVLLYWNGKIYLIR
jgi:hypothetical protein